MKLFYSPGACSLADHIALHEAGLKFARVRVDLKAKRTEEGADYSQINPKGYVPALQFDNGDVLTENIAILSWISDQSPALAPKGPMGRFRLLEMLGFISTEIHKAFKPFFSGASDADKAAAGEQINKRLTFLADNLKSDYLLGDAATVADAYLFVMLMWSSHTGVTIPPALAAYSERMRARPAVTLALEHEGLAQPAA
ncbi:MAG: glutathione binding-like protein [Phenylobacterium sp.]